MTDNIVFTYTWEDAILDGVFVDVTETALACGFRTPFAITSNLFESHIRAETEEQTKVRLNTFLMMLAGYISRNKSKLGDEGFMEYMALFEGEDGEDMPVEVWVTIEGRKPEDPVPVMTALLPGDY